jgi:hypothetical protein
MSESRVESRSLTSPHVIRAKQLHRGAKPRLDANHAAILEQGKAERVAMEEVRCGLVEYTPESPLVE